MKTDEELIEEYLSGESRAFDELLGRWLKPIYNFTYRYMGDGREAEEATQETFLKVWKNLKKFKKGKKFRPWIFMVARNTALDIKRKKKELVFSDFEKDDGENILTETLSDPEPLPDAILENAEVGKALETFLNSLPPDVRAALTLHYIDGLTFEEISEILGKPMNTVKSWVRRALILLKARLTNSMHQN